MSTISNLAGTLLHAVLPTGLFPAASQTASTSASSSTQQSDTGQLSSFAQLISTLQQLQQSNPAQYSQVTKQIATNLQSAAQTAQTSGNTAAATALNQLATDFTNASASGQLPNLQDLGKAIGGGHEHHHSGSGGSGGFSALLASLQSNGTQSANTSLSAGAIIQNTLTSAGITSA